MAGTRASRSARKPPSFIARIDQVTAILGRQAEACMRFGPGMVPHDRMRMDLEALAATPPAELAAIASASEPGRLGSLVARALLEEGALRAVLDGDGEADSGEDEQAAALALLDLGGFDLAPLEARCEGFAPGDPDPELLARVIAALAFRHPYDPFGPDAWDPEIVAATTAALAVGSAMTLATHVFDHDHDPGSEVHARVRTLTDIAVRACSVLRDSERSSLLSPWTPPMRLLRRSLGVLELDTGALVRATTLMPLLLHAGAGGNWSLLDGGSEEVALDEVSLRAIEHTLAELEPDERRGAFAEDPLLLAVALGHSWSRWDTGPGWIAPWDPAWTVIHAPTH